MSCLLLHPAETAGDVVGKVIQEFGHLDILVNNASIQHMCTDLASITPQQLQETFSVNVFGYFYMAQVRGVVKKVRNRRMQHVVIKQYAYKDAKGSHLDGVWVYLGSC